MPRTCWVAASIGAVRNASVISGEAPGQFALMLRRGREVLGRSSIEMLRQEAMPRRLSAPYAIAIVTGRRMDNLIILLDHPGVKEGPSSTESHSRFRRRPKDPQ